MKTKPNLSPDAARKVLAEHKRILRDIAGFHESFQYRILRLHRNFHRMTKEQSYRHHAKMKDWQSRQSVKAMLGRMTGA